MYLLSLKNFILSSTLLLLPGVAMAIPAIPWPVTITQADGSELTIQRFGDEFGSYTTTTDGYLLLPGNNGIYEYASLNTSGTPVPSGLRAMEIAQRDDKTLTFLSNLDSKKLVEAAKTTTGSIQRANMSTMNSVNSRSVPDQMLISDFPNRGKQKAIVVLVEYQDVKMTTENPHEYFNNMLNQKGFKENLATGSVSDYFTEVSDGQFQPEFDLFGPITLAHERAYYGGNTTNRKDRHAYEMAIEVCDQLDGTVDFTQYDRNGDGLIDNVFIFYAGQGEADYGSEDTVWPHASKIWNDGRGEKHVYDGMILNNYGCANEWTRFSSDRPGTFIHEFSHIMGLPDLYNTVDMGATPTPKSWSVMDQGPYNNGGGTPPLYSIFERLSLGWLKPLEIAGPTNVTMFSIANNLGFYIPTENPNEFFLFENRQQESWDKYLPYHGMLVWHVDYDPEVWASNSVNNNKDHLCAKLVRANGDSYSEAYGYLDSKFDPFPGKMNHTSFTSQTTPGLVDNNGKPIDLPITDIAEDNGVITFKVKGGGTQLWSPKNLKAKNVEGTTFELNWDAVSGAKNYLVRIKEKDSKITVVNNMIVNGTSYKATGLNPNSSYYCKVMAAADANTSSYSEQITVNTTDPTLSDIAIATLPGTEAKDNSFVANWTKDNRAAEYTVSLNVVNQSTVFSEMCNFNNKQMPEGWTTNAKYTDSDKFYGDTIPALQLSADQDFIQTSQRKEGIDKIEFTLYGMSTSAIFNYVTVYGWQNDQWVEAARVYPLNVRKDVITRFTSRVPSIKIVYTRKKNADIAIDDILITGGRGQYQVPVEGKQDIQAGNNGSLLISGLVSGTEYRYTVTGINGAKKSLPSEPISVWTTGASSVNNLSASPTFNVISNVGSLTITGTQSKVNVFDTQGRMVYSGNATTLSLPMGLYIVTSNGQSIKAMVK